MKTKKMKITLPKLQLPQIEYMVFRNGMLLRPGPHGDYELKGRTLAFFHQLDDDELIEVRASLPLITYAPLRFYIGDAEKKVKKTTKRKGKK